MSWKHWVLIGAFVFNLLRVWYMVDRPRETTGAVYALAGTVEFSFYIWLVVTL